jgi:DNA polymerase-4
MMIRKGLQHRLCEAAASGEAEAISKSGLLRPSGARNDSERVILHLDLDAFFAQVEEVADPLLQGKPLFVVGHSLTSGVVLTANYEARKYGVKTGMPLREARRLCPFALLVPADCAKYADTSERILTHLTAYTPLVEIFSIDEAFLDVTGTWHFWGSPEALAQEIKRWVWENFHLTLSVGIAPNKLLAKLASDRLKPNGLFRIRPEETKALLRDLPIEALCGIGERLKHHLNQMGVFTAGDLGRFSETALHERFGVIGLVLKRMGRGLDASPVLPANHVEEAKSMGHSYTLTRATQDRERLSRYLLWLSEKVARRLRRRGYEGNVVHATIRFSDFDTVSKQRKLPFFLDDGALIFEWAKKIFQELDRPQKPVRLLGVSVSSLRPSGRGGWLFEELGRRQSLLQALDSINDKYGEFTLRPALLTFPEDRKIASRALQLFGSGRH